MNNNLIQAAERFDTFIAAKSQIDSYIRQIWLTCCFNVGLLYFWYILNTELISQIQKGMIPSNPLTGGNIEQSYQVLFSLFYSLEKIDKIPPVELGLAFFILIVINLLFWISVALLIKWGIKLLIYFYILFRKDGLNFFKTFKGVQVLFQLSEEQPTIYVFGIINVLIFPFILDLIFI